MKQEELIKIYLQFIKIAICMMFVFSAMVLVGQVRAEDNKSKEFTNIEGLGFPKILDEDEWPSQLVYDTLGACYQGTIKWVILSNPSLLGQAPGPMAMRQMMEHCFCVMDKVRKHQSLEEYKKKVFDSKYIGDLFMTKALECVTEYKTLPSFFTTLTDNKTITDDNETIIEIPEDKPKDSQDEPPGQKPKESDNGLPETIFQG